jgi:hypothetical protein
VTDVTVAEALQLHYASNGLPTDGGRSAGQWALEYGPLALRLANFEWRQRALQYHDIHHVLTGYACTPTGEMEIAAWEFAAGRFPSVLSTLFCLPLVGIGAFVIPRRSFAAFARGRRSKTLYGTPLDTGLMSLDVHALRDRVLPTERRRPTARDVVAYLALSGTSLALVIAPVAVVLALLV